MIQPTWESGEVQPEASGPLRHPTGFLLRLQAATTSHWVLASPASVAADVLSRTLRCLAVLGGPVLPALLDRTEGVLTAAGPGELPSGPRTSFDGGS